MVFFFYALSEFFNFFSKKTVFLKKPRDILQIRKRGRLLQKFKMAFFDLIRGDKTN